MAAGMSTEIKCECQATVRKKSCLPISLIFLALMGTVLSDSSPGKQIFILSGQSNMAGRGGVENFQWDGIDPPECRPDNRRVFRLNAALHWEVAREPLHRGIESPNKTCGVGPGMPFATAVKRRIGLIGLVPCAYGGTEMKEWARGTVRYEKMLRRALAAAACGGCEVKALLWFQGESDTKTKEQVDSYRGRVETMFQNFRRDLHLHSLPIIQVAIATGYNVTYMKEIRRIQKEVNLSNVVTVDAKGLPLLKGDPLHLHLSTRAQVRLGRRMAKAYLTHFLG